MRKRLRTAERWASAALHERPVWSAFLLTLLSLDLYLWFTSFSDRSEFWPLWTVVRFALLTFQFALVFHHFLFVPRRKERIRAEIEDRHRRQRHWREWKQRVSEMSALVAEPLGYRMKAMGRDDEPHYVLYLWGASIRWFIGADSYVSAPWTAFSLDEYKRLGEPETGDQGLARAVKFMLEN